MIFGKENLSINKKQFINSLVKKGHNYDTILKAIKSGSLSKKIAPDAEEITTISTLFWIRPDLYNVNGERK